MRPAAKREGRRAPAGRAAVLATLTAAAVAACVDRPRVATDDQVQLVAGAHTADSLGRVTRWDDAGAIALGYLERLRLGLGSPFRLAEQAASDARMPAALGRQVAWGVLARTARGEAFQLDTAALGDEARAPAAGVVTDGGWHRATIDSVVRAAPTARTGEEAVRVAYALARAEGLVTARTGNAAVHAAALARDRRLAVEDVQHLLAAARQQESYDALDMVPIWRDARRFRVEMPLMTDALASDPAAAVREAEQLLTQMRQASARMALVPATAPDSAMTAALGPIDRAALPLLAGLGADSVTVTVPVVATAPTGDGGMPLAAARQLAALRSVRDAYPLAPIVVTLGGYRQLAVADSLDDEHTPASARRVRMRLVARATTEERLAAEWAVARAALGPGTPVGRETAALVQAAAVALRPWAQAPVEVASTGDSAIVQEQAESLQLRDGLRALTFERQTPAAWRPVAARQLGSAVADLRGVLPHLTLDGLTVHVAESPRRGLALALHDPRSRTVYLPPATSAGTVAHELVHDLDWQAARTHLAVRGVYGTDRLTRTGGTGELARAVRALAATQPSGSPRNPLGATPPGAIAFDADRPAERLARGADFFVAAALAREGRTNGVLSAVQDRVLTGYAGVTAPEPGDGAAEALMSVLEKVTIVPVTTRQWYLARFGGHGVRSPLAVAQFALAAQPAWEVERALRGAGLPTGLSAKAPDGQTSTAGMLASCGGVGGGAGAAWQARLLWLAADARARGYVRGRAAHASAAGSAWWGWNARGILGGPWQPEQAERSVARVRDAVLRAALASARRASGGCGIVAA